MKYLLLSLITISFISCASYHTDNRAPSSERAQQRREMMSDFGGSIR